MVSMVRARRRRGSHGGLLFPLAALFGLLVLFVIFNLIAFVPKVVAMQLTQRKQQKRLAEYQRRRAHFEAQGWQWECV